MVDLRDGLVGNLLLVGAVACSFGCDETSAAALVTHRMESEPNGGSELGLVSPSRIGAHKAVCARRSTGPTDFIYLVSLRVRILYFCLVFQIFPKSLARYARGALYKRL